MKREAVLLELVEFAKKSDFILACYEGGSTAFERNDELSDIDLYFILNSPEDFSVVFDEFEIYLNQKIGVEALHERFWPKDSLTAQRFYKLKNHSPYLLVDLALIAKDAQEKYLAPEVHGNAVVFFDKGHYTKTAPLVAEAFNNKMCKDWESLYERHLFFSPFIYKELERGSLLQAFELYRSTILVPLITRLRMEKTPTRYNWGCHAINFDLSFHDVKRLEDLSFVKDSDDLKLKIQTALDWFHSLLKN